MYILPVFNEPDVGVMHDLIRAYPFSTLINQGASGLAANHIPFHLVQKDAYGVLQGHVARANPVWQEADGLEVLVVFQGVNAYISPSWYATKAQHGRVVPTWNYEAVHAHGRLRVHPEAAWIRANLDNLTAHHEAQFEKQWLVDDAPAEYINLQIEKAIVGIEIEITRLEGKWKVSQNQPAENQMSVTRALEASDNQQLNAMAKLVKAKQK